MTAAAARARRTSTGFGFLAILLWGTSIAVGRVVMGNIGLVEGPLVMSLSSGALGTVLLLGRRSERAKLRTLPLSYWAACGGLFVLYMVSYNLGVGLARDGSQLLVFGMLNYLWPVLTVVFSAMIFHRRVSAWLFPGLSLAMAGIVLALTSGANLIEAAVIGNLVASVTAEQLATTGAARIEDIPPRLEQWRSQFSEIA